MSINEMIIYVLAFFLVIGALDHILGNKFGLGERFRDGFVAMGPLALVIVGIVSLAPVIANFLVPIVSPLYVFIGADPATFANTILALDMGGYALAEEMAKSEDAGLFAWVFLGTMLGPTIAFSIPVALGMIEKQDYQFFAKGILIGLCTIPIGSFIGGIVAGFDWSMMARNLVIPVLISLFIMAGLLFFMKHMIKLFHYFGTAIKVVAIIGLVAISFETLTGFVMIPGLAPLEAGIQTVGLIAIVLAGAFPFVAVLTKVLAKPLKGMGAIIHLNDKSTAGLIASLAHIIPMLVLLKEMDERGKVVNIAFAVSGAFVFGGHLGFVASVNQEMVMAMIIGKLTAGVCAVLLALLFTRNRNVLT
ncbi:ethanolamine utilization protein EutH [Alkalihalobacillus pseudalcaliphilus]|uniref:ethanolamine utilization protein EutH n=1 Tax=Alkalihalobacillus pseudalcaliphilus TaxID=79884 RepID=UPI00064D7613|nr:ethanolamine utilization protein EutH [Alkalihalobacillus pseudalcaliphilus]KMK78091.1 ethanolamine utilization protein EutH [Alkalihalobacillus pseudalcaliphilus]